MGREGDIKYGLALGQDLIDTALVDGSRRQHRYPAVVVLLVVPSEKELEERAPFGDRREAPACQRE
jgi:hypothetical protein